MRQQTMSFARAIEFKKTMGISAEYTACKNAGSGLNFDFVFQTWPSRKSMAKAIRAQQRRERRYDDWSPLVALTDGEGY